MDGTSVGGARAGSCRPSGGGLRDPSVHAEQKLAALTPSRGRDKRQITDEATLVEAIDTVLKAHRVDGWLSIAWVGKADRAKNPISPGSSMHGQACRRRSGLASWR